VPKGIIKIQDFAGGLVTVQPAHRIPDNASPSMQNVDVSTETGTLIKRKGIAIEFTEKVVVANPFVAGLFEYVQADGDKFILCAADDDVFNVTGAGTYTSIFTSGTMNGAETNFTTFDDLAIFGNTNITTQKWTGAGASSALLGTPPSNVKYIVVHRSRAFAANSSAGTSRLHYSSLDNPENWTATGDTGAGFIDIAPEDGDVITGISPMGPYLLVFKQNSTFILRGYKPSNFVVQQLSSNIGCLSNRSIVKADAFVIFLSKSGVFTVSINGLTLVSFNIKQTIEDIASSGVAAGRLKTQYWLAYDSDADTKNDSAYVLDYVTGIWTKYSNINVRVFLTKQDGTFLSGGSDKVIIRKHDTTDNDEGSAITMTWESKSLDFSDWAKDKQLDIIYLFTEGLTGKNLLVDTIINGKDQADQQTFSLTPATGEDKVFDSVDFKQSSQGRLIRIKLTNNETSARVRVYGIEVHAEVWEHQD